jgi:glucose-1-phosphate thymidylyltransferase
LKAIVPAAGIGTRLRPHTHSLPKALLYVAGRPIISHIIDEIRELSDVSSIVLIVGYKGDLIQKYVDAEYPDLHVDYVFQHERKGIGHAVHMTREVADSDEPLLIVLGDTIITGSKTSALGVKEVDDPRRFGVAETENGRIVRLVEKPSEPKSKLAMVGLYYLREPRLFFDTLQEQQDKDIRNHGEYQITDVLQMMIDKSVEFVPFEIDEWFDCGKAETLLETNRRLLAGRGGEPPVIDGSIVIPPVAIAPTASIKNCIIGPHVSIAANATIINSIIRDSVIDQGSDVADCILDESIIGSHSTVRGIVKKLNIGDSSEIIFK